MNDHIRGVVFVTLSFLASLVIGVAPAFAQTTIGLQLKPAVVEDQVNPGEVHQYDLSVTNVSSAAGTYYVSVRDIKSEDEQGRPVFSNTNEVTGYELSSWVTLPQAPIALASGETKNISFTVKVPSSASPGSHFGSVFFSDKPIHQNTSGSSVGFDVGSIVSLRISGDIHEDAQLREFSTGKLIYSHADVDFSTKVHNLGNVLVQPTGILQITNMFGKNVGTVPVNTSLASVFPNADRSYTSQWTSDGFAFGRYQAIVTLAYGESTRKTIYSTTSFWILPLVPILSVFGSLLLLILLAYWLMKSYIRRQLQKMGVTNVSRADTDLYRKKYQKSGSRLLVVTMAVILLCVVFLVVLFLLFA